MWNIEIFSKRFFFSDPSFHATYMDTYTTPSLFVKEKKKLLKSLAWVAVERSKWKEMVENRDIRSPSLEKKYSFN